MKTTGQLIKTGIRVMMIAALLSGCAGTDGNKPTEKGVSLFGYQLGPPARYDTIKKICIPRLRNSIQKKEPHLQMEATNILINEFTREQTYIVVPTPQEADGILIVELTDLDYNPVRWTDTKKDYESESIANEWRVRVSAKVEMLNAANSNVVWKAGLVRGKYDFKYSQNIQLARREAILQAIGDLSREIVQAAVERW